MWLEQSHGKMRSNGIGTLSPGKNLGMHILCVSWRVLSRGLCPDMAHVLSDLRID